MSKGLNDLDTEEVSEIPGADIVCTMTKVNLFDVEEVMRAGKRAKFDAVKKGHGPKVTLLDVDQAQPQPMNPIDHVFEVSKSQYYICFSHGSVYRLDLES